MPGKKKGGNGGNAGNSGNGGNEGKDANDFKFDFKNKEAINTLMPLLQQRVGEIVGTSSGYLETLPLNVQRRVRALKKLQSEHSTLEEQYRKERDLLEKKYNALKQPLYNKRADFVIGSKEPTDEELAPEEEDEEEETAEGKDKEAKKKEVPPSDASVKGIPDFWLLALQHHEEISNMITPEDEGALKHLTDIKWSMVADDDVSPSFKLEFLFSTNEYFSEQVLTKTYKLNEDAEMNDVMFESAEGTPITWKAGKNLTKKMVTKQTKVGGGGRGRGGKKGKGGGQTKTITVEEDVASFFHFFNPPSLDDAEEEGMDGEELENLQDTLEEDYEIGLLIKANIIPNAVNWFTGEVTSYSDPYGNMEMEDDEDDEEDEEDEEEEVSNPRGRGGRGGAQRGGRGGAARGAKFQIDQNYKSDEDDDFDPNNSASGPSGHSGQQNPPECKQQ